jgi:hypothetical protein
MKKPNIIKRKNLKIKKDTRLIKTRNILVIKAFNGEINTSGKAHGDKKYNRKEKHKSTEKDSL